MNKLYLVIICLIFFGCNIKEKTKEDLYALEVKWCVRQQLDNLSKSDSLKLPENFIDQLWKNCRKNYEHILKEEKK